MEENLILKNLMICKNSFKKLNIFLFKSTSFFKSWEFDLKEYKWKLLSMTTATKPRYNHNQCLFQK